MIIVACCGGTGLFAIVAATAVGGLPFSSAAGLTLTGGCLGGILVLGLWTRRLDGKIQRLDGRVQRYAETVARAPRPLDVTGELGQRIERVELAIRQLSDTADRLEERSGVMLATLGEDRVEAAYRTRQYTALLAEMAADLRDATGDKRTEFEERS